MDNAVANQQALAPNVFITGLEGALAEEKLALVEAEERAAALRSRIEAAKAERQAAKNALQDIHEAQALAVSDLMQARRDQAELLAEINSQGQRSITSASAQREEIARRIAATTAEFETAFADSEKSAALAEAALTLFTEKRELAAAIAAEQAQRHQILHDEYQQIYQHLYETVNQAANDSGVAQLRYKAEQQSLALAEQALAENEQALAAVEEEIAGYQASLDDLYRLRQLEAETIRDKNNAAIDAAKAHEEQAARESNEKRQARGKAESLDSLAQRSYANAEEKVAQLAEELKRCYAAAENESSDLAQKAEAALRHAMSEREAYMKILAVANSIDAQASKAIEEESELRERVMRLRVEEQDLRNASLAAANLAADATASRMNADGEMQETLSQMEQVLIAAAAESRQQALDKAAELHEAEDANRRAVLFAAKKRQATKEARKMVEDADATCRRAEQVTLELSTAMERRTATSDAHNTTIYNARQAYDQAVQEATRLKAAADATGNNLRLVKNEMEKADRAFIEAVRTTRQLVSACETEILAADEQVMSRINNTSTLLEIARQKREKLYSGQQLKKNSVEKCRFNLEQKEKQRLEQAERLETVRDESDASLSTHKQQLVEVLAADKELLSAAQEEANQRACEYDAALANSVRTANNALLAKANLLSLKQEEKALLETIEAQRQARETEERSLLAQAASRCRHCEDEVNGYHNPLRLAELDIQLANKNCGQLQAALELALMQQQRHQLEAERLEAKEAALVAAEQERLAAETAARNLAQRREAERLQRRQEEALRVKEQEAQRLAAQQEAARLAAEQAAAALAEQRRREEELAEQQAIRMAAGEVLSKEDNLALIDRGELRGRIQRVHQIVIDEAEAERLRWISPEEAQRLRSEAEQLDEKARQADLLFTSAQITMDSLGRQYQQQRRERYALGPQWAAGIAALSRAEGEQQALNQAYTEVEAALARSGAISQPLVVQASESMRQALAASQQSVAAHRVQLRELEGRVAAKDAELQESEAAYRETRDLLHEVASKWIYLERGAISARARISVLDQVTRERQEIKQAAMHRISQAKDAGAAVSEKMRRVGSTPSSGKNTIRRRK